eukprot:1125396-Prorocentrum_minimum.AAC.1
MYTTWPSDIHAITAARLKSLSLQAGESSGDGVDVTRPSSIYLLRAPLDFKRDIEWYYQEIRVLD